jgi:hypothetical protein
MARCGRRGMALPGQARRRRRGSDGWARIGLAGVAWTGMAPRGIAGTVWRGQARSRNGMARQAWLGKAWLGKAALRKVMQAWLGRPRLAPQDWQGTA